MPAAFRRIVQLLLVTLVINAGGWTFNREALAYVFLEAPQTAQADDAAIAAQPGEGKTGVKGVACNHWCHAVDHFVGFFSLHPTLLTEATGAYFVCKRSVVPPAFPEGRYRPPRLFS
ncbi:MAG: hypothetical protein M1449_08355 [Candidatus Thermoplasmatota archaeon]|nr:hypothetical protein [Candidatus Thermoplasmatota archaeon]